MNSVAPSESDKSNGNTFATALSLPAVFLFVWWIIELQRGWQTIHLWFVPWLGIGITGFIVWRRWSKRPKTECTTRTWIPVLLGIAAVPFLVAAGQAHGSPDRSPARLVALSFGCLIYISAFILLVSDWKTLSLFSLPLAIIVIVGSIPYVLLVILD